MFVRFLNLVKIISVCIFWFARIFFLTIQKNFHLTFAFFLELWINFFYFWCNVSFFDLDFLKIYFNVYNISVRIKSHLETEIEVNKEVSKASVTGTITEMRIYKESYFYNMIEIYDMLTKICLHWRNIQKSHFRKITVPRSRKPISSQLELKLDSESKIV